jgi:hypothetical protein
VYEKLLKPRQSFRITLYYERTPRRSAFNNDTHIFIYIFIYIFMKYTGSKHLMYKEINKGLL